MAYVITNPEYLEIDGIPLATPAWEATNLDDLWGSPDVRGDDILVPLGDGVRPQRRRPTVTQASVELAVVGDLGPDGKPHANQRAGLAANCDVLLGLAGTTGIAPDGTRLAILHRHPAAPRPLRQGRVHVLRVRFKRDGPNLAIGQMELSIPAGALL